jgi:hypothetical protein
MGGHKIHQCKQHCLTHSQCTKRTHTPQYNAQQVRPPPFRLPTEKRACSDRGTRWHRVAVRKKKLGALPARPIAPPPPPLSFHSAFTGLVANWCTSWHHTATARSAGANGGDSGPSGASKLYPDVFNSSPTMTTTSSCDAPTQSMRAPDTLRRTQEPPTGRDTAPTTSR